MGRYNLPRLFSFETYRPEITNIGIKMFRSLLTERIYIGKENFQEFRVLAVPEPRHNNTTFKISTQNKNINTVTD